MSADTAYATNGNPRPITAENPMGSEEKFTTNGNGLNRNYLSDSTNGASVANAYPPGHPAHQQGGYQDFGDWGGNPLAHASSVDSARLPAFAGYLQPGLYKSPKSNFGNPAPLGLSAFALTTFVLSLINFNTMDVSEPNIVVGLAFGYGGLVQLLAGMWELAVGNTFGATALGSYGGFWISFAIILTPGGFNISSAYSGNKFDLALGFYLMGWFIFTFLLWILTLRSTVVFSLLFFWLWLAFLMLGIGYLVTPEGGAPNSGLLKAGGMFGLLSAFFAWYVALAGIADDSNSFFVIPVWHFPWSVKGREAREKVGNKTERESV
ncbi:putative meiotically up-regulated gene 86 protein [Halenospora varia]|nr:putative meiotically up-regulated gene 86 protein [Halenospora varia]